MGVTPRDLDRQKTGKVWRRADIWVVRGNDACEIRHESGFIGKKRRIVQEKRFESASKKTGNAETHIGAASSGVRKDRVL